MAGQVPEGESFHPSSLSFRHHHQIHFGFLAKPEDFIFDKALEHSCMHPNPRAIQAFRHCAEIRFRFTQHPTVPVVQCKGRERIPNDQRCRDRANQPEVGSKGAGQLLRIR